MKSQILLKINNFIKNRLIESLGIILILVSFFILISILSYTPSDPNFIYSPEMEKRWHHRGRSGVLGQATKTSMRQAHAPYSAARCTIFHIRCVSTWYCAMTLACTHDKFASPWCNLS